MEKTYQRNLEALYELNRELYNRLIALKTNEKFDLFMGEKAGDVNIVENSSKLTLYDIPSLDLDSKLKELEPLYKHPFLVFFGIGNGFLFSSLLGNKLFKNIVVVEPEIELIYIALHLNNFVEAFRSLRLIIIHTDDFVPSNAMALTKLGGFGVYVKLYNLQLTRDFYGKYTKEIEQVNKVMIDAIIMSVKSHGNDLEDSLIGVDHFLQNIQLMVENIEFRELIKKKNSDVAVCVATGPSLTKQLPLLKEIQESVTIFCVDASLPILEKWGIVPDFVTSLERIPLTAKFFKNTSKEFQERVGCFVHSAVQHKEVIEAVLGKKSIVMRPFGYMTCFDLEQYGYAGIGMSAANFNYEVAYFMQYKKIVLIGQDLAFSEDGKSSHANDHIFGTMEDGISKRLKQEKEIYLPKWGGEGEIRSNETWVLFRNYFIQYFADSINTENIDATEGGAHIDGAIDMPFKEVVEKYVDRSFKKEHIVIDLPSKETIEKNKKQISTVLKDVIETTELGIRKLQKLQDAMLSFVNPMEELATREEQLEHLDLKVANELIEHINETKNWLLDDKQRKYFWESIRGQVVNLELNIAKFAVKVDKTIEEQNSTKIDYIFGHRYWTFSILYSLQAHQSIVLKYSRYIIDK